MTKELPLMPFRDEFKEPIQEGRKIATTRSKRYGWAGDRFRTPWGSVIQLTQVVEMTLGGVREFFWQEEGVASPEAFEAVWCKIHPRAGFNPDAKKWLHLFRLEAD